MYLLAQAAVVVECPQRVAFDYAANLVNFPAWFPGVLRMTTTDGLPFDTVGKQYREEFAQPMRGRGVVAIRVVEVEPGTRIVTEGTLASVLPRMEIVCRQTAPGACEVVWRMFSRRTTGWSRFIVLPLARRLMTRRARQGLQVLKQHLEDAR
ncbi:SRPBCC family protein [Piscinibacter gummiphilus]|uniref:SRPBCC family protein n=1 Tax=Piscinibacter gummiphilus TaxID=946333 RepID=A0ABZ0CY23_9BURK|nr:SRPBCC family protein [Piscinibacter gummiphilus]WOB09859.1 SRPBCC family protein [Piscinibacter gummiphilus]